MWRGLYQFSVLVNEQKRTRCDRIRLAIGRRDVADDDKSALQHAKRKVKPSGGGVVPWKKTDAVPSPAAPLEGVSWMIVVPVPWRLVLPLQEPQLKFETRNIARLQGPTSRKSWRHKGDAIGIEVAVRRDRRRDKESL